MFAWLKYLVVAGAVAMGGLPAAAIAEEQEGVLSLVHQGIPHDALYDICFREKNGFAVGVAGAVLTSEDAGATWRPVPPITQKALLGATCAGASPIIVGQAGYIQVLDADGKWRQVASESDARLLSVSANADGLAVAVGGFGAVLLSQDGGNTWSTVAFDWEAILNDFLEPHIYGVTVFPDGTIVIAGEFELMLRSVDRGQTWEVLNKGDSSLFSQTFLGDGQGYAVGQDGKVLKTLDNGATWESLTVPTSENLLDVWATVGGKVLITGIRTLLFSNDGGRSWERIDEGDVPVKWYQSVSGVSVGAASHNIFMVGHSGRIIQIKK